MSLMLLILTIIASTVVQAGPVLPKCLNGPSLEKNAGLIHKAAMMGSETRRPIKNLANRSDFAATGVVKCYGTGPNDPTTDATVQLVVRNNVVIGPAHTFAPNCKRRTDQKLKECEVTFPLAGGDKIYRIKPESLKMHDFKPNPPGDKDPKDCYRENKKIDWAVFELTEPVSGVDLPYALPPPGFEIVDGMDVTQVAAKAKNLEWDLPPVERRSPLDEYNIQECKILDQTYYGNASALSNCHTGWGSSGAAQMVIMNQRHTVVSINTAQVDGNLRRYDPAKNFNISVPIAGKFREEIDSILGVRQ